MGETRVSVNLKESFGWFNKPYYEVLGAAQLTYTGLKILESMDIGIGKFTPRIYLPICIKV